MSFSSQHEAAWETKQDCTIKVTCLQNLQLGCCKQKDWGKRGNTEHAGLGLQGSLLYLPQTVFQTYLAKILRQTFPKSAAQFLQSCRPVQSISLNPSSTGGPALRSARGSSTSDPPQKDGDGGAAAQRPRQLKLGALT